MVTIVDGQKTMTVSDERFAQLEQGQMTTDAAKLHNGDGFPQAYPLPGITIEDIEEFLGL